MRNYPPPIQTVSCIIPVYNAGVAIGKCIESLLAQTYHNMEIIIIDDGSTDDSGRICDEYSAIDNRITVFHQENRGVSTARNQGLKRAKGDWIMFVDADDETEPMLVEQLVTEDADWVIGGYRNNRSQISLAHNRYNLNEIPDFYAIHFHRLYSTVPWGKLYRHSIINDNAIMFDSRLRLGEDLVFNLQYLLHCNCVATIPLTGYIYNQTGIGAERYKMQTQEIQYTIDCVCEYVSYLEEKYCKKFDSDAIKKTLVSTYPLSLILEGHHKEYKDLYYKAFPHMASTKLLNDRLCSPIIRGIRYLKFMIKSGKYRDALIMMRKMHRYERTVDQSFNIKLLTFPEQVIYLLYLCCKHYI